MIKLPNYNSPETNFNIRFGTIVKITAVVLLMIVGMRLIGSIMPIILLFLAALFLAAALNPLVAKISQWLRIKSRVPATTLAFALIVICLLGVLLVTVPPVLAQVNEFAGALPDTVARFLQQDNFVANLLTRFEIDTQISNLASTVANQFATNIGDLVNLVQRLSSFLMGIIIILVMTYMILIEGPSFIGQVQPYLPAKRLDRWRKLGREMNTVIVGYINAQLIIALLGGLSTFLFAMLLGVPNPLAMGTIMALFSFIPLIGIFVGATIVVALTFLVNVNLALVLIVFFIVYQQIENATIQPIIQGQKTNLSTLQVFIAALIGATIGNLVGVFLAIPVAACLKIFLLDYFRSHQLDSDKSLRLIPHTADSKDWIARVDRLRCR